MADEFDTKLGRLYRKAQLEWLGIVASWTRALDAEDRCGDWEATEGYLNVAAEATDRLSGHTADALDLSRRGQKGEDNIAADDWAKNIDLDDWTEDHWTEDRVADAEED